MVDDDDDDRERNERELGGWRWLEVKLGKSDRA